MGQVAVHLPLWPEGLALRLRYPSGQIDTYQLPGGALDRVITVQADVNPSLQLDIDKGAAPGDEPLRLMIQALRASGQAQVVKPGALRSLIAARLIAASSTARDSDPLWRATHEQHWPAPPQGVRQPPNAPLLWWPGSSPQVLTRDIAVLCKQLRTDDALLLFREALRTGVRPSLLSRRAVVHLLGVSGRLSEMHAMVDGWLARGDGAGRDLVLHRLVIQYTASLEGVDPALRCLDRMRQLRIGPNADCLLNVILACEESGDLARGRQIVLQSIRLGEDLFHPSLGMTCDGDIDFHAHKLYGRRASRLNRLPDMLVPGALVDIVFTVHLLAGRLTPQARFITGKHGKGAVRERLCACLRRIGWVPMSATPGVPLREAGAVAVRRVSTRFRQSGERHSPPASAPWLKPPST